MGALFIMISAAAVLVALLMHLPAGFPGAAGLVLWLGFANIIVLSVTSAIALTVIRLISGARNQQLR